MFNLKTEDKSLSPVASDHARLAFQTLGTDFSFQEAKFTWKNAESLISNLERYLKNNFKFEFKTFKELEEMLHRNQQFEDVYSGDFFVYDEKNGDSWSGYYGSKPDLKMHITRIFNSYRTTESLLFITRLEHEILKSTSSAVLDRKLEIFRQSLELFQKTLDDVRKEISILLHHDAITGTSSPSAEHDWL